MSSPTFHPVQIEDIPRLAEFCANFPGDGRSVEFWTRRMRHWWIENPAMTEDWLMGYQLFVDGTLQGIILNIPLRVLIEGQPHQASLGTTWRVMPRHRAWSLALGQNVDSRHNHLLRFNGSPSPRVLKILPNFFGCIREQMPGSLHFLHPLAVFFKAIKRPAKTRPLPKLILPKDAPDIEAIALSVDMTWQSTSKQTTGPVRDWRYWQWFSEQNPSTACSTAILPEDPLTCAPALCALVVDFGDGRLQINDLWPSTASSKRIASLLNLIRQHAWRANFHTLLIPHWNDSVKAACSTKTFARKLQIKASVWTNHYPLPAETTTDYWPTHTGDSLL